VADLTSADPAPADPAPAAAAPAAAALVTEGLAKLYADLVALEPLDLTIAAGEMVALVGHNGSGKSTLLRLAAGLLEATAGSARVAGTPVGSPPARAATSYLPDDPVLYDDLSVREHLAYVASLHGAEVDEDNVERLIARVGLAARADDLPSRFSRGLRQKASIALALVRPFELLVVDEPFVGLDATGKASLLELLAEANAAGAAVVVATHDASYVERVSRCIALREGAVVLDGTATPQDVLSIVSA